MNRAAIHTALALMLGLSAAAAENGSLALDERGAVSQISIAGRDLLCAASVEESGFAICDRTRGDEFVPLRELTPGRAGPVLRSDEVQAQVEVQFEELGGALQVGGTVRSLTEPPRCLTLRFALPVDLTGWRWHQDLHQTRAIAAPTVYRNGLATEWGGGWMSLWPFAAVSDDRSTIGLATRIDEPRLVRFSYLGEQRLLVVEFDVGLSEHSIFATSAPFRFFLVTADAPTGLREVLARYYELFPELFVERTEDAGGWFAWGDIERQPGPLSDFGLMFHESPESEQGLANDTLLGLVPMPYIEPGMYQLHFGDQDDRPTREQVLERLRTYADPEFTGRIWSDQPAASEEQERQKQRLCEAVLTSGARDPDGELIIGRIGQFSWVAGSRWAAQLPCLLDPDISAGRGQYLLDDAREHVLGEPRMKGAYLDSYSAHMRVVSYAPEHLAAANIPPVFAGDPPRPCVAMPFAAIEYVEALRDLIGEERVILPNLYGFVAPYPWHQFDVLGKEHWVAPAGWLMQSFRMLGRHKVVTQLPAYEDQPAIFLRKMLLYDVFPGGYARRTGDPPVGMREDYRALLPLLRVLHRLTWQPLTGVSAEAADTQVERYGERGGLQLLVVHSPFVGRKARLHLDAAGLGIAPGAWCSDPLDDRPLNWRREGDEMVVEAAVEAGDVRLIAIGETADHRRLRSMLAEDRVADAALCLREYRMRQETAHPAETLLQAQPETLGAPWLRGLREALVGDEPSIARARELADDALALVRGNGDLRADRPETVAEPSAGAIVLALPYEEDFEQPLDRDIWDWPEDEPGVRLSDGKLELEIARGNSAGLSMKRLVDFSARPAQLDWDFQYNHSGGDYYLMLTFSLAPPAEGAQDILRIRLDPGIRMRVENGETAPSNFTVSLTDYTSYETNVPHHMTLQIGPERYALWIDGALHGRGEHRLGFTHGRFTAGVYSGHGGFGDVCWMDNLRIHRIDALTDEPLTD